MTDERLVKIERIYEEMLKDTENTYKDELDAFAELIQELRAEQAKVESMKDALFLLNSMVKSGETHTEQSESVVLKAIHGLVKGVN